ncbi:MAG: DUF3144 domain-containing protein, partial [Gammaproteobacteria bacterium]|nr:DUF3144 domain-containing protein [Gammaproteobacteria bacterium]
MKDLDENFYYRADEHINLSNRQLGNCDAGKASASMMYATARFNSWLTACGFESASEMLQHKDENIDYFVKEYRK